MRQSLLKDIYCSYRSEKRNWCIYILVKIPFCNKSKPRDEKIIVYIFYGLTDIFKLFINFYAFTKIVVLGYLLPVKNHFILSKIYEQIRSKYFIIIAPIRSIYLRSTYWLIVTTRIYQYLYIYFVMLCKETNLFDSQIGIYKKNINNI